MYAPNSLHTLSKCVCLISYITYSDNVIHFGQATHSYRDYYLNGVLLDSVDSNKDLGILFDTGLKSHQYASEAVIKANRV